jgi:hypothetical protein
LKRYGKKSFSGLLITSRKWLGLIWKYIQNLGVLFRKFDGLQLDSIERQGLFIRWLGFSAGNLLSNGKNGMDSVHNSWNTAALVHGGSRAKEAVVAHRSAARMMLW